MDKKELDDFIRYVKEQFDCEIYVEKSDTPDSFEQLFGTSFFDEQDNYADVLDSFAHDLCYENNRIDVRIEFDSGMVTINSNTDQAA